LSLHFRQHAGNVTIPTSLVVLLIVASLCLSLLIFQVITGVPPMSSSASEAADVVALLKQARLPKQAIVYELGSGWGSLVIALARAFPDAQIRGIETSPLPYWVARFRTRNMPNVFLQRGNFHECDLQDAHAVTCYLMIKPCPNWQRSSIA
jgi:methylase of polypeptide subunit release factors